MYNKASPVQSLYLPNVKEYQVSQELLTLARESRGMTQKQLADATSISQASISKYETGFLAVPWEHLENIAEKLHYPINLFLQSDHRYGCGSCLYYRKRQSVTLRDLTQIEAQINIRRMGITRLLKSVEFTSANKFLEIDLATSGETPQSVARKIRATWKLPFGPIHNVVRSIEGAGGIVIKFPFGATRIDALSHWVSGAPPLFFVGDNLSGDRYRLTLAHELGHVLLHGVPTENVEIEATAFAAEFLMPADQIAPDLTNLTFPKLADLKRHWKVSMAALIVRAHELGELSSRQYRTWFTDLGKMGFRKTEPIEIPVEESQILRELFRVHMDEYKYSKDEISQLCFMFTDEFDHYYSVDNPVIQLVRSKPGKPEKQKDPLRLVRG